MNIYVHVSILVAATRDLLSVLVNCVATGPIPPANYVVLSILTKSNKGRLVPDEV